MRLKEFEGTPNRVPRNAVTVTLNHRGVLRLNPKAFEAIGAPKAVTLHYDENERIIGIKPEDIRRRNAFPLKIKDYGRNRVVHILPFCKHWMIKIERTVLFHEIDMTNDGIMLLPLAKTIAVGNGWTAR
ncbi:MAG: hypothetical protein IPM59_13560 [Chloracidobacterium sp.]|nr:hypothetical protein [Chloracidobacterium sp.]